MVFDVSGHVHFATYLRFLLEAWSRPTGHPALEVVVPDDFPDDHPELVADAQSSSGGAIRFWPLSADEHGRRVAAFERARAHGHPRSMADVLGGGDAAASLSVEWQLVADYAARTGADATFFPHLDGYLPMLAAGHTPPTPVAGIWFAPTFHYQRLGLDRAGRVDPATALHQRFVLARVLTHRSVARVLTLDPYAASEGGRLLGDRTAGRLVHLPDPVEPNRATDEDVAELRRGLGIESRRRVLLLFGHQTARKGPHLILDALADSPPGLRGRLAVVLAGPTSGAFAERLRRQAAAAARAGVQVIERLEYLPDATVQALFRLADVVGATYPAHPGMSGVTLLAAAAGTPLLSGDHGLMGRFVDEHGLGVTVDVDDGAALRAALAALLDGAVTIDRVTAREVVARHSPAAFADGVYAAMAASLELAATAAGSEQR